MGNTSLLMFPIYGLGALLTPIGQAVDRWLAVSPGEVLVCRFHGNSRRGPGKIYTRFFAYVSYNSGDKSLLHCSFTRIPMLRFSYRSLVTSWQWSLSALKMAAESGVDVRLMIPCKPDHPFLFHPNPHAPLLIPLLGHFLAVVF